MWDGIGPKDWDIRFHIVVIFTNLSDDDLSAISMHSYRWVGGGFILLDGITGQLSAMILGLSNSLCQAFVWVWTGPPYN